MNKPIVSIIVPVYKAENCLHICVDSILNQSFRDFELILVDDGSPDNSGAICDAYAAQDSRVVVIHQVNCGVSAARNHGLDVAGGEYVSFVDSDDWIDPLFLEEALWDTRQIGADFYISGLRMETFSEGKLVAEAVYRPIQPGVHTVKTLLEGLETLYPQICICGPCCKLCRRSLIETHHVRFQEDMDAGEDTFFNLELFRHVERISLSDKVYYHYFRGNGESLFSRFHPDTHETMRRVYDPMRELMLNLGCSKEAMVRFENMYFGMAVGGIHEYYRFKEETTADQRKQIICKVADNPYVRGLKGSEIFGKKQKLLCILLKLRCFAAIQLIFTAYYSRK